MTAVHLDDKSRVRLSLPQLWTILAFVAGAAFVIAGGLYSFKGELVAMRNENALDRLRSSQQLEKTANALADLKADRSETLRDWNAWRSTVNEVNSRQDREIQALQIRLRQ